MNNEGWSFRKNTLDDTYEINLEVSARIMPKKRSYGEPVALFSDPNYITIAIPSSWFKQPDPGVLLLEIERQFSRAWSQAIAGMARKYTELIYETITPSIQEILDEMIQASYLKEGPE